MSFLYTASEIVNVTTHTIKSFSSRTAFIDKHFGVNTFFAFLFFTVLWVSLKTFKKL